MKLKFKIAFGIAAILAVASWFIAIYYWDKLPAAIPIHFGISGAADGWANKSIFQVFLLPSIQTMILGLLVFVYYKPQYSNIPSTMWLEVLDRKNKEHAYNLIRTLNVGVLLLVSALFTYIVYNMNQSAVDKSQSLSTPVILIIVGLMLFWIFYWAIRVYRDIKQAVAPQVKR